MKTVMYLYFGGGADYANELIHAVLSARHTLGRNQHDCRFVVVTDQPAPFADLPVTIELTTQEAIAEWRGPFNHKFRTKAIAIREMMKKYGGTLLYCDTDTYFLGDPHRVFDRVGPGRTVMHASEGTPAPALACALDEHEFTMLDGTRWNISSDMPVFNAGVIGIHESDRNLIDEVIHLIDQICPLIPDYFGTEQFSFSACLSLRSHLSLSNDVIHHYWLPSARTPFRELLARTLHDPSAGSYEDRFRALRRRREWILDRAETLPRRAYVALWYAADRIGILKMLKAVKQRKAS